MAVGFGCARPFIISSRNSNSTQCCGCKANIPSDVLQIGVRIDRVKTCTVYWYHYNCFWTHSVYAKHLRGSAKDVLNELVEGLNSVSTIDRQKFQNDASTLIIHKKKSCTNTTKLNAKVKGKAKEKLKFHKGSVDDGDYEVDPGTLDLTDMMCLCVHKLQTDITVSIRHYFKPMGALVAKPTREGISLSVDQWNKLTDMKSDIDGAVAEIASRSSTKETKKSKKKKKKDEVIEDDDDADHIIFSLFWKRRISVYDTDEEVIIDIRDYSEDKTFCPSPKGVLLTVEQWEKLQSHIPEVDRIITKLKQK